MTWERENGLFYLHNISLAAEEIIPGNVDGYSINDYGFNIHYHSEGWELFWFGFYKMTILSLQLDQQYHKIAHFS